MKKIDKIKHWSRFTGLVLILIATTVWTQPVWAADGLQNSAFGEAFTWNDSEFPDIHNAQWTAEKSEAFACDNCGKSVSGSVSKCPHCGLEFEKSAPSPSSAGSSASDENFIKPKEAGFFIGVGATLAIEEFETGDEDTFEAQFDNTGGYSFFVGYKFNNVWSIHARLDHFPEFEGSANPVVGGSLQDSDGNVDIFTLQAALKIAPELPFLGPIRPFGIFGVGVMFVDADVVTENASTGAFTEKTSINREDVFVEVGGGIEVSLGDMITVGGGVTYVLGTEKVDEFKYIKITVMAQLNF